MPTELKLNKKGEYVVSTKSHVREGLDTLAAIDAEIEELTRPLRSQHEAVKAAVDGYVIAKYQPGDGYEDDDYLATKVVAHRRSWNVDKLTKLVPRGILKNVLKISVDGEKVDQYVRAGKIDADKIKAAYEETPNKPYVKITPRKKGQSPERAEKEAEGLASAMGGGRG
jgi:hypothetical protein